ncbi:hypothetical protein [Terasakiella pusilla]|uniref:hypothetical protein n=1 Tax=Terasakiella pusilla TaxID=64973 RepID=UPI0012EB58E0|nr:hypothetical protein [Terasakiella pusilla]
MTHDFRRIEIVRDVDADDYYFADAILDRLSGQEISDLKTELLQRKESDRPKYRCPHCSTPLFVRYRPVLNLPLSLDHRV